jgi:hypothetical protein
MVKPALQAAAFVERLPRRPYCTNDPALGLLIRMSQVQVLSREPYSKAQPFGLMPVS